MKRLLTILIVLLFSVIAMSQVWVQYWGLDGNTKIVWGKTFLTRYSGSTTYTDSVNLMYGTTLMYMKGDSSAYFTNMLKLTGDGIEGIGHITFSVDSVPVISNMKADSICLFARKYVDRRVHTYRYWSPWYKIGGFMKSDTLYEFGIVDSSWWKPGSGWQFKCFSDDTGVDTLYAPNLGPYIR